MVALPWGSRSMSSTRRLVADRDAARLMAVVVLPTPPFWFVTARILLMDGESYGNREWDYSAYARRFRGLLGLLFQLHQAALGVQARHLEGVHRQHPEP